MLVYGESSHQLDEKGRINIPRKFQPLFERGGFLTRAFNGQSLVFFSYEKWEDIQQRLTAIEFTELAADDVARYLSCGTEVRLDGQGRLSVPPNLRRRARLDKDVTLVAMGQSIEIWDNAVWEAYNDEKLTPTVMRQALQAISPRRSTE